jgi:8-oxo-dGTP diphosphatase
MTDISYKNPLSSARLAADVVIFTVHESQLKVLLIERTAEPFKDMAVLPGGFVWEGETTLQTAERALAEKAGVIDVFIEQLYTFDALDRDPRHHTVSVAYYALVPEDRLILHEVPGARHPNLVPVHKIPKLAFDHNEVVTYALARLQAKVAYSNAAYSLLPELFTFAQLQDTYEVILNIKLDKRNFRKKYLALDLIEPTETKLVGTSYRPPQLYSFKSKTSTQLPSPFL